MQSEKLTFLDAIWLSTMTVTTVGYEVPLEFSDNGKIISILLMLFGVGTVLYVLTTLAVDFFNGTYLREYKQKKLQLKMKQLNNHIIICGFGRNGRQAARKLLVHKRDFVVVDSHAIETPKEEFKDGIFIQGNAIEDEVLLNAGIEKAYGLVAALPSDADNLFIVVTARQLNPNLKIVSRASNSNSVTKLKSAGADNVIMPDKIGGEHMASLIVTPDLAEFLDEIVLEGTQHINLMEINTNHLNKTYLGMTIRELDIVHRTGCKVIGYKDGNYYQINPEEDRIIEPNCSLILLGQPQQIKNLQRHFISN